MNELKEIQRYLPILEELEKYPWLWEHFTKGTGIATLNGYRAAITEALQTTVSNPQWVKASERNPDKEGYYFTYRHENKVYRQMTFWYSETKEWSSLTYEWLDESPTPQSVSNEEIEIANLKKVIEQVIDFVTGYVYNSAFSDASADEPIYREHEEIVKEVTEEYSKYLEIPQ